MDMEKEIILTPEELYYMGTLLQAKYIDYAYVAAMGDIQQRRGIYESRSREGLAEKGILMEDFSGGLEVDEDARRLLEPVFFGTLESSVDVAQPDGEGGRRHWGRRFHFYEGRITATSMTDGGICLEAADEGMLQTWIAGLLPAGYAAQERFIRVREIDRSRISRIIVVKSSRAGERAYVNLYAQMDDAVFRELEDGRAESLTREKFCLEVYRGLKGSVTGSRSAGTDR